MLQPTIALTLGNFQYTSHVSACGVSLGLLPQINHATVTLPAAVPINAGVGDQAELTLGGEGEPHGVLTGKVRRIERRLSLTQVLLVDGGAQLAQTRPAATYEKQDGGAVIRNLARLAGIPTGAIRADLPLVSYVAHQGATAAEHIAKLAALAGALARFDDAGRLEVSPRPTGQPDLALRYGREFLHYAVQEGPSPSAQWVLVGNGPAGDPAAPGAARPGLTRLPASAPDPGPATRYQATPLLKTPTAAVTAGKAANAANGATTKRLTAHCWLLPQLRPGQVIQVQDLPAALPAGPWLVEQITHTLGPEGAQTVLHATWADTDAFGLAGLLGAALNLAGGLL